MSAVKFLKHLFIPHDTNNQKARILHTDSLALLIIFLIGFQFVLNIVPKTLPSVLGYAANISPQEVINLTNQQRAKEGLSNLTENSTLDSAALAKGNDMLAKGYWAHFAPDGTSPWSFFTRFGYKYQYAGENLARDFSDAGSAVAAWMNSPTHKENILNPHYKEIGIGVVQGSLAGADTTIIVQFFGSALSGAPAIPIAKAQDVKKVVPTNTPSPKVIAKILAIEPSPVSSPLVTIKPSPMPTAIANSIKPLLSPFESTKNISTGVIGLLLLVLSIDLLIVKRKRITRIGGRTLAHIAYLSMILAVILILRAGRII